MKRFPVRVLQEIAGYGAQPSRFWQPQNRGPLPPLEQSLFILGHIVFVGICCVLLNSLYGQLVPLARLLALPLMLYFIWPIWRTESGDLIDATRKKIDRGQ